MNFNHVNKPMAMPVAIGYTAHGGSPTTYYALQMLTSKNEKNFEKEFQQQENLSLDEGPATLGFSSNAIPSSQLNYTPLHHAAALGQVFTVTGLLENTSEMVEINQQDHRGNTALMWAASEGYSETVAVLVENDADLNMQNFAGETALTLAAARGHLRVCNILLENGAMPSLSTIEQVAPLHMAAANGHLDVIRLLVRCGAFVNAQDEEGDTALHFAIREQQYNAVRCLVSECGAWVDAKNEDLETPLQLASCLDESEMVQFLSPLSVGMETEYEGDLMVF